MASLLSLVSELLPMVMPASVDIVRASDLEPTYPTVEGPVIQRQAVVNKCDRMCTSGSFGSRPSTRPAKTKARY